jgi:histone H3/H4
MWATPSLALWPPATGERWVRKSQFHGSNKADCQQIYKQQNTGETTGLLKVLSQELCLEEANCYRLSTMVFCEITCYPKSPKLLIFKLCFQCLVINYSGLKTVLCFQSATISALEEANKVYLLSHFEDINLCVIYARHITIMSKDIQLSRAYEENMLKNPLW